MPDMPRSRPIYFNTQKLAGACGMREAPMSPGIEITVIQWADVKESTLPSNATHWHRALKYVRYARHPSPLPNAAHLNHSKIRDRPYRLPVFQALPVNSAQAWGFRLQTRFQCSSAQNAGQN